MVRQFTVFMERDEDGWITVECPELPGCVTQARTEAEALDRIQEAILVSVETRHALKLPMFMDRREIKVEVPV
jgi:predicted RNase H-like HicB family nuclease